MPKRKTTNPGAPVIAGPWQELYRPIKTGCYVNDHCLFQAVDGTWHLFGITRETPDIRPVHERYFTHAAGPRLHDGEGLKEIGVACDFGVPAWAPCVVWDGNRYFMYYGPSPLRMCTSNELSEWWEHRPDFRNAPLDACHRDPMILRVGKQWLLYATGLHDQRGAISVFTSADLVRWDFAGFALTTGPAAPLHPAWGATESPFVVAREGFYYLFITYTDSAVENYHDTLVFRSKDPLQFGQYNGNPSRDGVIARLHAHAPEVVYDADTKRWYITTCGWRGRHTPVEGGVAIAPPRLAPLNDWQVDRVQRWRVQPIGLVSPSEP